MRSIAQIPRRFGLLVFLCTVTCYTVADAQGSDQTASGAVFTVALTGKYPPFSFYDNQDELVVTHDMPFASQIASEGVQLDNGCVKFLGDMQTLAGQMRFSVNSY